MAVRTSVHAKKKPLPDLTHISADIDPETYNRFKASCSVHGQSIRERMTEIMRADADAAGIPARSTATANS